MGGRASAAPRPVSVCVPPRASCAPRLRPGRPGSPDGPGHQPACARSLRSRVAAATAIRRPASASSLLLPDPHLPQACSHGTALQRRHHLLAARRVGPPTWPKLRSPSAGLGPTRQTSPPAWCLRRSVGAENCITRGGFPLTPARPLATFSLSLHARSLVTTFPLPKPQHLPPRSQGAPTPVSHIHSRPPTPALVAAAAGGSLRAWRSGDCGRRPGTTASACTNWALIRWASKATRHPRYLPEGKGVEHTAPPTTPTMAESRTQVGTQPKPSPVLTSVGTRGPWLESRVYAEQPSEFTF